MRGNFDNTFKLVRFILRRERITSLLWIVILVLFTAGLAPAMNGMFDGAARQALAETLMNPAMIAMVGPVYGAENYTAGAMFSNMMLVWVAVTVAVMNIFLVVRHTRADEEKGRAEVVRSLPTGRLAGLNAVMITEVIVNAVLALLIGFGIAIMGIESMDFSGSMLFGAALGAVGLVFAAIATVFSQLSSSSRGAIGYSVAALGIFYMLRAGGDINSEVLSLISPLGLVQRSQIYVLNKWWCVAVLLLEAVIIFIIAYMLGARRDIDQGFIPAKPGREDAKPNLLSSFGLSFRLVRNTIITWFIVMFTLGASYGSIMGDIENFVAESEFYKMMIGVNDQYSTAEMFTTMVNSMASLICLIPLLTVALKPHTEEKEGRAEHILSRSVLRVKFISGYVVLAFAASILNQFATALGLYVSASSVFDKPISFVFLLKANMIYLPALWVMIGFAVLLIGLLPKATALVWVYFGGAFFLMLLGRMLTGIPEWLLKISPFSHIPQLPVDNINYVTLLILTFIAAALTFIGFVFYRKRDVTN